MKLLTLWAAALVGIATFSATMGFQRTVFAGDDNYLMMEMLNAVGKGLENSAKMKDCVAGNSANWSRCNMESQQRINQYMDNVNRRVDEMTNSKLEEIAVDICKDEEDESAFERCVRNQIRKMKR